MSGRPRAAAQFCGPIPQALLWAGFGIYTYPLSRYGDEINGDNRPVACSLWCPHVLKNSRISACHHGQMTCFTQQSHRPLRLSLLTLVTCLLAGNGMFAADQTPAVTPTTSAVPAYRQANHVAILTIHGAIDDVTQASLERRMKKAIEDGADAIVLDIDTPGGEMRATLNICNLLKNRNDTPANVVAWIHPTAYSAGSIIALACREIIVAPQSTFGDAAPIAIGPLGGLHMLPKTERAKLEGPLLSELTDSARRNHYDEKLVRSFSKLADQDDGVWMLQNIENGDRVFVDREEYREAFGQDPPAVVIPAAIAPVPANARRSAIRPSLDTSIPPVAQKAGLDAAKLQQQQDFDQTLPPSRTRLTAMNDRGKWRLIRQVVDSNTLLTVTGDEAMYYGLATAAAANDADIKSFFGAQSVRRYDQTWSESLVRFLISAPVKGLLIIVFLIGLFVELAAPGLGIFGGAAVVALLLLVGAPALAGMATWWPILLIVLGLLLVAAELFVIPGFGITGVAGVISLMVGLVWTFVSSDVTTSTGQSELLNGLLVVLTSVFVAGIAIWFISRQIHSLPLINRLILHTELRDADSASGTAGGVGLLEAMGGPQRALQSGDLGVAETDLRPSGRANINGRLVDVKSAGPYIEKGTAIRVLSVGRFVIEVEEQGP